MLVIRVIGAVMRSLIPEPYYTFENLVYWYHVRQKGISARQSLSRTDPICDKAVSISYASVRLAHDRITHGVKCGAGRCADRR